MAFDGKMEQKLQIIMSENDFSRILKATDTAAIVDLHGMSCKEMKRFVRNICALYLNPAKITLIHGYTHGTALMENIRRNAFIKKSYRIESVVSNPGISIMHIA